MGHGSGSHTLSSSKEPNKGIARLFGALELEKRGSEGVLGPKPAFYAQGLGLMGNGSGCLTLSSMKEPNEGVARLFAALELERRGSGGGCALSPLFTHRAWATWAMEVVPRPYPGARSRLKAWQDFLERFNWRKEARVASAP